MLRSFIVALSLSVSACASHDWAYTSWGMSPEQVQAAAPAHAKMIQAPADKQFQDRYGFTLLYALYHPAEGKFGVEFKFNDTKEARTNERFRFMA